MGFEVRVLELGFAGWEVQAIHWELNQKFPIFDCIELTEDIIYPTDMQDWK